MYLHSPPSIFPRLAVRAGSRASKQPGASERAKREDGARAGTRSRWGVVEESRAGERSLAVRCLARVSGCCWRCWPPQTATHVRHDGDERAACQPITCVRWCDRKRREEKRRKEKKTRFLCTPQSLVIGPAKEEISRKGREGRKIGIQPSFSEVRDGERVVRPPCPAVCSGRTTFRSSALRSRSPTPLLLRWLTTFLFGVAGFGGPSRNWLRGYLTLLLLLQWRRARCVRACVRAVLLHSCQQLDVDTGTEPCMISGDSKRRVCGCIEEDRKGVKVHRRASPSTSRHSARWTDDRGTAGRCSLADWCAIAFGPGEAR